MKCSLYLAAAFLLIPTLSACAPSQGPLTEATPRSTPVKATDRSQRVAESNEAAEAIKPERAPEPETVAEHPSLPLDLEALRQRYGWLDLQEGDLEAMALTTLERHIKAPEGYTRDAVEPHSYAAYLRELPVRTDRKEVLLYDGSASSMTSGGVIPLDLGDRDLHQCADSVIRLYAEYLWSQDRAEEAAFHYTSGDLARWRDWRSGKVLKVKGRDVIQVSAKASPDTHEAYRSWLDKVFTYASTRSLHRDAERVERAEALQAGDFFLQGGSPGHVVMILDVAKNERGERVALIGQGYLPAREFHVVRNDRGGALEQLWFELSEERAIETLSWHPFSIEDAWRFAQ